LRKYLGEMAWYLDAFFNRREGGVEAIGGMHKWVMPCNWKFPAKHLGGDGYHTSWSHLSAIQTGADGDFRIKLGASAVAPVHALHGGRRKSGDGPTGMITRLTRGRMGPCYSSISGRSRW
jgi:phenylpropionate dioxygenase-like ring-hydroxylating dioxygenase large terminal subunit